MEELENELDWILNKNWEEDDNIHTRRDGIQYTGYINADEDSPHIRGGSGR